MWATMTGRGLSRFFGGGRGSGAHACSPHEIPIGSRYYEIRAPHSVWTVERYVKSNACNIPHVIIVREGICPASKIISTAVLLDDRHYRPDRREPALAEEDGQAAAQADKRRRKNDLPAA